jgi:hypothetical protein
MEEVMMRVRTPPLLSTKEDRYFFLTRGGSRKANVMIAAKPTA